MNADPAGRSETARLFQPGLTGIRALAALWVVAFHLNAIVGPKIMHVDLGFAKVLVTPLLTVGWAGVDLFFVLSGFLLTTHLLESAQRKPWPQILPAYFWARCRRVFPAYWAQMAILLLIAVIATHQLPDWLGSIPAHAVMVHNLTEDWSGAINPVYWTLPMEFAFYLALPTLARILAEAERKPGRRRWTTLAVMLAALIALTWSYRYLIFRLFGASGEPTMVWAISQLPGTIDQFAMGVAAAAILRWWHPPFSASRRQWVSTLLVIAGLAGVVAMAYFIHYRAFVFWKGHWSLYVWHTATSGFFALLVLGIALSGPLARFLFENRLTLFLGTISYSIYLWHFPIVRWTSQSVDMSRMDVGTFALLVLPAVLAASAASYYLVERRFMSRKTVQTLEMKEKPSQGLP
jgi:peptidoglycan/LPS O-acetylase OafA/YrhL